MSSLDPSHWAVSNQWDELHPGSANFFPSCSVWAEPVLSRMTEDTESTLHILQLLKISIMIGLIWDTFVRVFPSLESVGRWGFIPSPLTILCLFPVDPHYSICLEFTGPAAWLVGCSVIILLLMLLQKRSCFILIRTLAPFVKPFVKLVCIWTKSLEVQLKSMFLSSQVLCGCDFLSTSIGRV